MVSRVTENAGLIFASPLLLGCGCLAIPLVLIVMAVFASVGIAILSEVVHNIKPIAITLGIAGIIAIGVVLFKRYGAPQDSE
jgi:hypothetical protein